MLQPPVDRRSGARRIGKDSRLPIGDCGSRHDRLRPARIQLLGPREQGIRALEGDQGIIARRQSLGVARRLACLLHEHPGVDALGPGPLFAQPDLVSQTRAEERGHVCGHGVAHAQHVGLRPFEALVFEIHAAPALDQPHRDAQTIADRLQSTGDAISRYVDVAILCRAVLRDHIQGREPGEPVDQLLGQSVGEIVELLPLAQIREIEHRDAVWIQPTRHRCFA